MKRSPKGHWDVKVRYGKKRSTHLHVPADFSEPQAAARAVRLRELADLVGALDAGEALVLLRQAASAATAELPDLMALGRDMAARATKAPVKLSGYRFKDVGDLWTSGELHRRWPDDVPMKKSVEDDRRMLAVLCKAIGDKPIATFSLEDAEAAVATLPTKLAKNTRRHYKGIIARVLSLAVFPCRFIQVSPIPKRWVPRLAKRKAMSFLYPEEDAQLLSCSKVPFSRRVLYGFLDREGCRLSEALSLEWKDLDLKRGAIRLDANKTGRRGYWVMREDVAETLRALREQSTGSYVFKAPGGKNAVTTFREDLALASIDRPELFERTADRQPIRVHDLRSTFVVLALAADRSETWIMDRTGHTTSGMLRRYDRPARFAREADLAQLGRLDGLLDLRQKPRQKVSAHSNTPNSRLVLVTS